MPASLRTSRALLRRKLGTSYTRLRVGAKRQESEQNELVVAENEPPKVKRAHSKEAQRELFRGIGRGKDALEQRLSEKWGGALAGVDEVGRGPLAGPVVAAAVILPPDHGIRGITDSKELTHEDRAKLDRVIREKAVAFGIGVVEPEEIDRINILNASLEAMRIAVASLREKPAGLLVDGVFRIPNVDLPQQPVIKGDLRCRCIGAASILAKVYRDAVMTKLEAEYPGYGFAEHKGYPCESHRKAIRRLGPTPAHRRSFDGVLPHGEWDRLRSGQGQLFATGPVESGSAETRDPSREEKDPFRDGGKGTAHIEKGEAGEDRALAFLIAKGWTLVERNWRTKLGELDLVVKKDDVLAFVEVKARESAATWRPEDAVNHVKQRKLERAARAWLQSNEEHAKDLYPRFDVITVVGPAVVEHLEDAFEARSG